MPYEYFVDITSVHDGDTFRGKLDLGFHFSLDVSVRIYGINSPELTITADGKRVLNPAGERSTIALLGYLGDRQMFSANRNRPTFGIPGDYLILPSSPIRVVVKTVWGVDQYDKYGRVLGSVYTEDDVNIGHRMIDNQWAEAYFG